MRADGFTYVELLLAMAFMTVIVLSAHQAILSAGRRASQLNDAPAADAQAALDALATELRSAGLSDADTATTFVVRQESGFSVVDFFNPAGTETSPAFQAEAVSVERGTDGRSELFRRTNGRATYLCGNVLEFDVTVFNGERWEKQWGWNAVENRPTAGIRGLPGLVMIRLTTGTGGERRTVQKVVPILSALLRTATHG